MESIHRVTVPIPFPLQHAHSFLLESSEGWVMVDAGFASKEAADILLPAIDKLVSPAKPLRAVVITHFHPDHTGLAGYLEREHGAEVIIHAADWDHVQRMRKGWGPSGPSTDAQGPFADEHRAEISAHMAENAAAGEITPPWERARSMSSEDYPAAANPTLAHGGERHTFGDRTIELVWTPGHTDGHLCIYDEGEQVLFTGDHILSRITPHIGMYHGEGANPLHQYEQSLDLVIARGPGRALGAHEEPIEDVAVRAAEIKAHHDHRRQEMLDVIGDNPRPPLEIAKDAFPRRRDNQMQLFMALSETLAHLDAMVREGSVERLTEGERTHYRRV